MYSIPFIYRNGVHHYFINGNIYEGNIYKGNKGSVATRKRTVPEVGVVKTGVYIYMVQFK